MAVLVNQNTKVITQGISGKAGRFHTEQCLLYGSKFVGGVTPGKKGQQVLDLPVFDTVYEAKKAVDCNATVIFVPAPFAADAILEAEDAGIEIIVCITEGILVRDMLEEAEKRAYLRLSLETGSTEAFAPARSLYARFGFRECGPFADYVEDPYSVYMTREL